MEFQNSSLVTSADWWDDDDYDYDDYYDNYYDDDYYDDDYYDNGTAAYNPNYVLNDGVTVSLFGYENSTIDLRSGLYGSAINISAAYSYAFNSLVGNYAPNVIMAGAGPTYLWGGDDYANDILVGGWSNDVFYYGKREGFDLIQNASAVDTVNLYDSSLSDIIAVAYDGVSVHMQFNTGNVLAVACTDYISPTFTLANGARYAFNRVSGMWQNA